MKRILRLGDRCQKRNTIRALVRVMQATILENLEMIEKLGFTVPMIACILRKAA